MKKNLLLTFIIGLFCFAANAQIGGNCQGCDGDKYNSGQENSQTYSTTAANKRRKSMFIRIQL